MLICGRLESRTGSTIELKLVNRDLQSPIPLREAACMLASRVTLRRTPNAQCLAILLTCVAVCADQALQRLGGNFHIPSSAWGGFLPIGGVGHHLCLQT